ncbi:MAG: Gfo/Idh/MocA family oxidoreductase [Candidatus Latescibacteria bacterium]|jgi:scyllo-inositol 2-dehydrogenase (NADP+)|nr:Gfo/Idh/MocA family oxidoreductase [Candidatus Latescibacterota bacterium]MBT5832027.1 Gfo/Idh/MocA family oxidoreductase [Candidatus Latescibacterota bacterium]
MSDKIRVAIGGQGRSGYNIHSKRLMQDTDRFTIASVADQLPERREDAEVELKAEKVYSDWRPMLEEGGFDLFVNSLPSPLHVDASIAALNAGCHVICEKPNARTVADFDRITEAAEKNDRLFFPFQNNRLQPFFDKIQEVLASGVLGDIVHIRSAWSGFRRRWDWQTRQDLWGGSLLNTGPHAVDQALCLFGWENTPEVFCRMDCRNPFEGDAENHITMTLWDPERKAPQIDIDISSMYTYSDPFTYNISGTNGGLIGGPRELKWKYFDPDTAPKHDMWLWSIDRKYPREELKYTEESWTLGEPTSASVGYTLESMPSGPERFYNNVYDVLANGAERLIKPEQTRKQIAVMEEAHRQNPLPKKPQSLEFKL